MIETRGKDEEKLNETFGDKQRRGVERMIRGDRMIEKKKNKGKELEKKQ